MEIVDGGPTAPFNDTLPVVGLGSPSRSVSSEDLLWNADDFDFDADFIQPPSSSGFEENGNPTDGDIHLIESQRPIGCSQNFNTNTSTINYLSQNAQGRSIHQASSSSRTENGGRRRRRSASYYSSSPSASSSSDSNIDPVPFPHTRPVGAAYQAPTPNHRMVTMEDYIEVDFLPRSSHVISDQDAFDESASLTMDRHQVNALSRHSHDCGTRENSNGNNALPLDSISLVHGPSILSTTGDFNKNSSNHSGSENPTLLPNPRTVPFPSSDPVPSTSSMQLGSTHSHSPPSSPNPTLSQESCPSTGRKNQAVHQSNQVVNGDGPILPAFPIVQPLSCSSATNEPFEQILPSNIPTNPVMLLQTGDLALGGSLTCTVVNILRGLHLLDRCGLEDLCASLYGLCDSDQAPAKLHSLRYDDNDDYAECHESNSKIHTDAASVTRSSSFTSPALISPRRATLSDYSLQPYTAVFLSENQPRHVPQRKQRQSFDCIVRFILRCSQHGSVHQALAARSGGHNRGSTIYQAVSPRGLHATDWRRGCAANLITLLASPPVQLDGVKQSRSTINRLLTGRFIPGANGWRGVWPRNKATSLLTRRTRRRCCNVSDGQMTRATDADLVEWITAWLSRGAVLVLAELQDQVVSKTTIEEGSLPNTAELSWRHRLLYGVTQHSEVFLSNPVELVPVGHVLNKLSRQATIQLDKCHLTRLWAEHDRLHRSVDRALADSPTSGSSCSASRKTTPSFDLDRHGQRRGPSCSGDYSPLACQPDPRWNRMNVLGQVLQTLRGLESNETTHQSHHSQVSLTRHSAFPGSLSMSSSSSPSSSTDHTCLSPSISIPASQSPGFSVFVARSDWELVHALFHSDHPPSFL